VLCLVSGADAASLVLHWTAPGDDGNTGRASTYELRYSESAVPTDTASWWGAASSAGALPQPLTAGTRETYTVAGLDSGKTYYFVIRTADEVPNWSGFSNVSVRSTIVGTTLPTPGGFAAQNVSNGVRLTWNAVTSGNPAGYHIYRAAGSGSIGTLLSSPPMGQTSWIDSTVVAGAAYQYSITSYSGGNESAPATASIVVPGAGPPAVVSELVGFPNPGRGKVTLRFRAGTSSGTPGHVRLVIYGLNGQRIATLVDEDLPAGETQVEWKCQSDGGRPVAPGLYNAILDAPLGRVVTRLAIVP